MQFLKSSRDAIGTAAGVAWPTFGILFNTLGLAMGGLSAILLGSMSLSLFIIVALPIAYWSYKNHTEEKKTLKLNMQMERKLVQEILLSYLMNSIKNFLIKDRMLMINGAYRITLIRQIKEKLFRDTETIFKRNPVFEENLEAMLNNYFDILTPNALFQHTPNKIKKLKRCINHFIKKNEILLQFQKPSIRSQFSIGVMCFTASFGSVAGCMAGMVGLLVGLGIIAGLAAAPIVGWVTLGAALILGVATAAHSIKNYREKYKKNLLISFYKKTNNHFINTNKFINTKFLSGRNRKFRRNTVHNTDKIMFSHRHKKKSAHNDLRAAIIEEETTALLQQPTVMRKR